MFRGDVLPFSTGHAAEGSRSTAPVRAGSRCVCGEVQSYGLQEQHLFSPTQPRCVYHAKGCLADCSTVTAASASCLHNLFVAVCMVVFGCF